MEENRKKRQNEMLNELHDIIKNKISDEIVLDYKLSDEFTIGLFIPSLNIGFDIYDLVLNSEVNIESKNFFKKKKNECLKKDINLIQIFEDEWINKKEICVSRIKNIIGVTENKVFARNCEVVEISKQEAKSFFDTNHIQGHVNALVTLGLRYNDEIISMMSFCKLRKNLGNKIQENHWELLRFCNKINYSIVGGASKLFDFFVKQHDPVKIITYADKRWSNGNMYEKLGFTFYHESEPSYFYIINNSRKNRFGYRKDILISKYGCEKSNTEHNFCFNKGWYRIYDCGTKVYHYLKKQESTQLTE